MPNETTDWTPGWMSPQHNGLLNQKARLMGKRAAGKMTARDEYDLAVVLAQLDGIDEHRKKAIADAVRR